MAARGRDGGDGDDEKAEPEAEAVAHASRDGLTYVHPFADLDVVAGEPRYGDYRYAINNSFGFGGHNVALAFGRY